MKQIPLTQGRFALVDDHWFDYLSQWKWYYTDGYAAHKERTDTGQKHILMHRVIMNVPKGKLVDHRNGDMLDNQEANLRLCNHSTNAMNMRKHKGSSIYKGVTKRGSSCRTVIWKDNAKVFDASFPNERWAAYCYDLNAPILFGEYARLNFPEAISVLKE